MLQSIQNLFQPKREKVKLALCGLASAGKTTLLYKLKQGEVVTTIPTIGFNVEDADISQRHSVTAWDLGGRCKMRPLTRHYIAGMDVVFFVVDSSQPSYMEMASAELAYTAKVCMEHKIPLIILANKQDLDNALSPRDVYEQLRLKDILPASLKHTILGCSMTEQSEAFYKKISNTLEFVGNGLAVRNADEKVTSTSKGIGHLFHFMKKILINVA